MNTRVKMHKTLLQDFIKDLKISNNYISHLDIRHCGLPRDNKVYFCCSQMGTEKRCYCFIDDDNDNDGDEKYDSDKCIGLSYIHCPKCNDRTCYGCYHESFYEDTTLILYYCNSCKSCYAICYKCFNKDYNNLCKLVRHYYFPDDAEIKYDNTDNSVNFNMCYKLDSDGILAVTYNKNVYHLDEKLFGPITGPDGGFYPTFYCTLCKKELEYIDK